MKPAVSRSDFISPGKGKKGKEKTITLEPRLCPVFPWLPAQSMRAANLGESTPSQMKLKDPNLLLNQAVSGMACAPQASLKPCLAPQTRTALSSWMHSCSAAFPILNTPLTLARRITDWLRKSVFHSRSSLRPTGNLQLRRLCVLTKDAVRLSPMLPLKASPRLEPNCPKGAGDSCGEEVTIIAVLCNPQLWINRPSSVKAGI